MAVVAVALGFLWTRVPAEDRGREAPARRGTLVYASQAGSGGTQRLWKLELATGRVEKGPRIPVAEELLAAPYPGIGWMGLTSLTSEGRRRASVLYGTAAIDRPAVLGEGDLVAWGPRGQYVVVATRGPLAGDCHREVTIELIRVETGDVERVFNQRNLCGDLRSIGRDGATTYFTRLSSGRPGIFYAGIGVAHPVLPGHGLVSVSSTGDMLVSPLAPHRSTLLFWLGRGGPISLGNETDDLEVSRVLGWSADASEVLVTGRLGDRAGLFRIRAGAGEDPRVPHFVVTTRGPAWATFDDKGVAFVVLGDRLYAYEEDRLRRIALPAGAPTPDGPIAWMP